MTLFSYFLKNSNKPFILIAWEKTKAHKNHRTWYERFDCSNNFDSTIFLFYIFNLIFEWIKLFVMNGLHIPSDFLFSLLNSIFERKESLVQFFLFT